MKYIRNMACWIAGICFLALPAGASTINQAWETMSILPQDSGGSDGLLGIGLFCVIVGVWLWQYIRKKRRHLRRHSKHRHKK